MEAFGYNKVAGAVLSALQNLSRDIVWTEPKPQKPGWALPVTEVEPSNSDRAQVRNDIVASFPHPLRQT